jgi:hypothetical protein
MKTKTNTKSQLIRIHKHLISGKSLTAIQALNLFGCFRLAARIADLKKMGSRIKTTIKSNKQGKRFASYSI